MSKKRFSYLFSFAAASVLAVALAGCGGSSGGGGTDTVGGGTTVVTPPVTTPGGTTATGAPAGTAVITAAAVAPATTNTADNPAQAFGLITAVGAAPVTVNSPPVVNFTVIDSTGKFVSGLALTNTAAATSAAASAADLNCGGANVTFAMAKWDGTYWQNLISRQRFETGSGVAKANPTQFAVVEGTTDPKPTAGGQTIRKADNTTSTGQIKNADDAAAIADPSKRIVGVLKENTAGGYYTYYFATDVVTPLLMANAVDVQNVTQGKLANNGNVAVKDGKTVHRIGAQLCYVDPATKAKTVVNPTIDFTIDANGAATPVKNADGTLGFSRQVVSKNSCNECHQKLAAHGTRVEPNYCVMCHNPGSTDYNTNNPIDYRVMIHRIHFGKELTKDYKVVSLVIKGTDASGNVSGLGYSQDVRNCVKCHDGSATATNKTAQGDNWKGNPTRAACGSCHDGINFATGKGLTLADAAKGLTVSANGHVGGSKADDTQCVLCHGTADIPTYHIAATPPNAANALFTGGTNGNTNSSWLAGNQKNLPEGAVKISYDISSVSVSSTGKPTIVFRILADGVRKDFNTFSATKTELWDNFMGSPSVYFVWAVPQDGISAPADFNASASAWIKGLWNGSLTGNSAGTLTGPDANGYYTATLTGVTIPAKSRGAAFDAVMVTGGIGYTYSLPSATAAATAGSMPLTQTNLSAYPITKSPVNANFYTGGLVVVAQDQNKVATGYTGRRAAVADAKCDKCHEQLGLFTAEAFHSGQRNDGPSCSWCHNPNRTSSGWSAGSSTFVHAIHGGQKRTTKFTWHAASTLDGFWNIGMPPSLAMPNSSNTVLRNCETCHVAGMYDFSNAATTAAYPNMLWTTVATGTYASSASGYTLNNKPSSTSATSGVTCAANTATAAVSALTAFAYSPYITQSTSTSVTDYGLGFTYNPSATANVSGCEPTATANVYTPYYVAAGGKMEADPTTLVTSPFTAVCVACHDGKNRTGTMNDVKTHMTQNGGTFYKARSTVYKSATDSTLVNSESCLLCHGPTGVAAIADMHKK